MNKSEYIVVDLDGTLTFTDTLHEATLALVRKNPLYLFLVPFWILRGIAYLKSKVSAGAELDVTMLPYNMPFIDWLEDQKTAGRKLILCTAANERIARGVAEHLGIFDDVIGSDDSINLKGENKRARLDEIFGYRGYSYAGNSEADIRVWEGCASAIVVNASQKVEKKAAKGAFIERTFSKEEIGVREWFRALRPHQWLKNLLLFVPFLAAHQALTLHFFVTLASAFASFSLCASAIYIINDLLDLESDRHHSRKRYRPFAAAKLTIMQGAIYAPVLLGISFILASDLGANFEIVLTIYLVLTAAYSLILKRLVLIDCLTLASLYTIRIVAGGAAVNIYPSFWLLAFSIFIFLSLALVKRYAELIAKSAEGASEVHGRGYVISDTSLLQTLGVSAGYISALVLTFYMRSDEVLSLYSIPIALWLLLPMLLFWVSWVWLQAARGEMHDDPIVFAVTDKASLLIATLMFSVVAIAASGPLF